MPQFERSDVPRPKRYSTEEQIAAVRALIKNWVDISGRAKGILEPDWPLPLIEEHRRVIAAKLIRATVIKQTLEDICADIQAGHVTLGNFAEDLPVWHGEWKNMQENIQNVVMAAVVTESLEGPLASARRQKGEEI